MQIKVISLPVVGGEAINDELNRFLRGHKILQVEQQFVSGQEGLYWTFCIRYIDGQGWSDKDKKERTDYKATLSEDDFARFSKLRTIRKGIAEEEGIPAFAIFTDEELAGIAQIKQLTLTTIKSIKGIGDKKCEKYGQRFLDGMKDEKSE